MSTLITNTVNNSDEIAGCRPYSWIITGPFGDGVFYGKPIQVPNMINRTVQLVGPTFASGTFILYGSNNPADLLLEPTVGASTWQQLRDSANNLISSAAAANMWEVMQNPTYITWRMTGVVSNPDCKVFLNARQG